MGKGILPRAAPLALVLAATLFSCGRGPLTPSGEVASAAAIRPAPPLGAAAAPIRAAYFYSYMSLFHLDSLAAVGFNRAIVKSIGDSLGNRGVAELRAWADRAERTGVELVPAWTLQSRARLAGLSTLRRYTWGAGTAEPHVGCPLDEPFWRSALLDRAGEILSTAPAVRRLALDLEIYHGSRHHYDAGACLCAGCMREHRRSIAVPPPGGEAPDRLALQEGRLTTLLTALLREFAGAHPGVELGVFDLDRPSFVHRALARALARAGVPTTNYTERTYQTGGRTVPAARAALDSLGLSVPTVGGLWLGKFPPATLPLAVRSVTERAEGYFVFTTFSLWLDPSRLDGPYTLLGTQDEYWAALRAAHR